MERWLLQETVRMTLTRKTQESLSARGFSRRQISRIALGAAAAFPFFNEFAHRFIFGKTGHSGYVDVKIVNVGAA